MLRGKLIKKLSVRKKGIPATMDYIAMGRSFVMQILDASLEILLA